MEEKKKSCASCRGRRKGTILKYARPFYSEQGLPSGQTNQSLNYLEKGKYPTPAHTSHPVPPEGRRKNLKSTCEVHGPQKSWALIIDLLKSYLVHFTQYIMFNYQEKLQGILKGKNIVWRDRVSIRNIYIHTHTHTRIYIAGILELLDQEFNYD